MEIEGLVCAMQKHMTQAIAAKEPSVISTCVLNALQELVMEFQAAAIRGRCVYRKKAQVLPMDRPENTFAGFVSFASQDTVRILPVAALSDAGRWLGFTTVEADYITPLLQTTQHVLVKAYAPAKNGEDLIVTDRQRGHTYFCGRDPIVLYRQIQA